MNRGAVLVFAFLVGLVAAVLSQFFSNPAVFMGQFILTLGMILYADVINEIGKIRSDKR